MANKHVYIKPVTWAGRTNYFLGRRPSRPTAEPPSKRLCGYFLVVDRLDEARAIAQAEAERFGCRVVECPNYVGL